MKLIIDVPDDFYERMIEENGMSYIDAEVVVNAFYKGTLLPKGHGRLIDADNTLEVAWQEFYKHEEEWEEKDKDYLPLHRFYDQNGFECCQQTIVNAPTIIEADKEAE